MTNAALTIHYQKSAAYYAEQGRMSADPREATYFQHLARGYSASARRLMGLVV